MANVIIDNGRPKCPECDERALVPISPTHLSCTLCAGIYNTRELEVAVKLSATLDFSKAIDRSGDHT